MLMLFKKFMPSMATASKPMLARHLSTGLNFYKDESLNPDRVSFDEVDRLKEQISSAQQLLEPNLKAALHHKLKLHWTYNSNAIEGSTLSLGDTIFFLEHGLTVGGKPLKDFLDAKNHADALDYFYDVVADKREINPYLSKEINAMLLLGIKDVPATDPNGRPTKKPITPGKYKTLPNHVIQLDGTIHQYVAPMHTDSEMDELFNWIGSSINMKHPIVTAAVAHYNMVRIHPFDDGNGRGARILMNLILMKKGYPPAILKLEDRKDYIEALNKADKGDIAPFVALIAKSLLETEKMIFEEIERFKQGGPKLKI